MVLTSYQVRMNRYLDPEFTLLTSSKYDANICSVYQETECLLWDQQPCNRCTKDGVVIYLDFMVKGFGNTKNSEGL